MDRTTRQKINKETEDFNSTIRQLDLMDIYRTFPSKQQNTFFSSTHKIFFPQTTCNLELSLHTFEKLKSHKISSSTIEWN